MEIDPPFESSFILGREDEEEGSLGDNLKDKAEEEEVEGDEEEKEVSDDSSDKSSASAFSWLSINKEDYCFPTNISQDITIRDDITSLINGVLNSEVVLQAQNLNPTTLVPNFRRRESWNATFTSMVTTLRMVGQNPLLNTLSIPTLQLITDQVAIPSWLPTLPPGVSSSASKHPSGEWFYPTDMGLKIRKNAQPDSMRGRYILYLHGGAFCCCHTGTHRGLLHHLVHQTGASILSVNYRRPPEHPYPIPVDDCLSAYLFLLEKVGDPNQIFFAGDSAGGNLVINTLFRIAEHGLPKPAGAVLLSPWVDLTDNGKCSSWTEFADVDYLSPGLAGLFAESYAGGSEDIQSLSPLYSDALHVLPPLMVEFGQCEVLHDQIWAFCDKARQSGVDIRYHARPDMVHVFPIYAFSGMPQCQDAFDEIVSFLEERSEAT
jgi:acetyl esterase/lipase